MKAFLLTKFITFVSVIFMGWGALAADQTVNGLNGLLGDTSGGLVSGMNNCNAAATRLNTARSEAVGRCKDTGLGNNLKACASAIDDCRESITEEQSIMPDTSVLGDNPYLSQIFSMDGGTTNNCAKYTGQEYDSKERDLKRDLKDTKKALQDAQKQKAKDLEDYNKDVAQLDEKMQEAQVEKVKQDAAYGQEQRDKAQQREQSAAEIQKAIDSKQMEILQYQSTIKLKIASRQNQVNQYRIDLLKCKIEAESYMEKAPKKKAGSLSSLGGKSSNLASTVKEMFDSCTTAVLNRRTAEGEAYQGELDSLNLALAQFQNQLAILKQNQANANSRNSQADQEEQSAKAKKDYLDLQRQQTLLNQKNQALQVYQQKYNQNESEIRSASFDVNKASNDLSKIGSRPYGEYKASDATKNIENLEGALEDCKAQCKISYLDKDGKLQEKDLSSKCGGSSSKGSASSSSASGADGK